MSDRRNFIKKTAVGAAGIALGVPALSAKSYNNIIGANEKVIMGVIGLRGRGKDLMRNFSSMYSFSSFEYSGLFL